MIKTSTITNIVLIGIIVLAGIALWAVNSATPYQHKESDNVIKDYKIDLYDIEREGEHNERI